MTTVMILTAKDASRDKNRMVRMHGGFTNVTKFGVYEQNSVAGFTSSLSDAVWG